MEKSAAMTQRWIATISLGSVLWISLAQAAPKTIRIDFIEALAMSDTTSSERFKKDFEGAIQLGKSLLSNRLNQCGYSLDTRTSFYESSDALKAKDLARQVSSEGSWLIVGPRRSNHYLLLTQGAPQTATVSLMASADEVANLEKHHISLSPTNSQMAAVAVKEIQARKGAKSTYVTVVADDCVTCVDFARAFDSSGSRLKKLEEIKVRGESADLTTIKNRIIKLKPDFVLLPNYSKLSSLIMSAFNDVPSPPLFVGGDGWGDNRYGFVQNGQPLPRIHGFTVRGLPPTEKGLRNFRLGRKALQGSAATPFSASGMALLKIMETVAEGLCSNRPSDKTQFAKTFDRSIAKQLRTPWGVSIYDLKSGEITFNRTRKLP